MNTTRFPRLILASSIALALAACGGSDHDDDAPAPAPNPPTMTAGDVFAITVSNKLISFNRDAPATIRTNVAVTGLQSGENLHGIDMRPADGLLYALGSSGRIYTINTTTGAASVKSTLAADATDTTLPYTALSGTDFGVDFNPAADRLRVVSNTGQSLRINVDTGATTTDGAINGGAANAAVTASAYTNSFAGTATTTLYALDTANDTLYVQNPPNNGTLSTPVALGVDAGAVNGMDIDARSNMAYAVLTVGGARNLYTINLAATSAPATSVGALGINEDIRGIALRAVQAPVAYGLTDDARLLRFKPATPNTIDATVALTGMAAGETLLGIDFRPKDGLLYGITSNARIVTIDPASGAATVKATLSADATDTTAPYAGVIGTSFVVDFNPAADRLRVIGDTGQNLRINVDTGATTTDGAINRAGFAPVVSAGAYTNSFAGATATTLYDVDRTTSSLAIQNPPNDGTLALVGPLGVTVAGSGAMDIAGGANGLVLAALRTGATGPSSLYRVDLATGAATLVNGTGSPGTSAIGNGQVGLRDMAILIAP
ncbi:MULTISPECIES: DUF4394 domain-containing protein [unclassified Massilia]|uniref:DUF4394 domain-containing protein n=1 Tax=unclassified Massilia TaxID=2609279 RepID=UPI001786CF86|nr:MULTISPECIES: DUF4394 domain-containing protein [unclassified Massilia]MBD8531833.1 DUF4394 domain-containing protein [Massilia sp. CFBP 13647]MBD8675278.1 DUF4394 domain-containing protein [Massilia sp. CFBP 13721]